MRHSKDYSGSYAVFTEQGSSASQMTAAKVMDIISRLPGCAGQAADAVSANTQVKMEDAHKLWKKFRSQNVQIFGYVYQNTNGPSHGPVWKIQLFLLSEICTVILWQDCYGNGNLRRFCWNTVGKKFQIGNAYSLKERKDYWCLCTWTITKWQARNEIRIQCGKYLWKTLIWENRRHSLTMFIFGTQRECQRSKDVKQGCCRQLQRYVRIQDFCWGYEKLFVSGKSDANIHSWSNDMEGHAKKCVERYFELANKTTQQLHKVATPCMDDHQFKEEENESVRELPTGCSQIVLKCLYLARIFCEYTCSCSHKTDESMWQTLSAFDLLHSSYKWIPAILLCGKHSTRMQSWIVSRLWFCKRSRRLKINIRWTLMHFRKSNICANKSDVQESDMSLTQFTRSRNYFSGCKFTHGRNSSLDLWDLVIDVFHSSPNQINEQIQRSGVTGKLVAEHTLHMKN